MATDFTDFSDSPTITERWNTATGAASIETSGLPSGAGTHAFKIVRSSTARYYVSLDDFGTPSGDVELLAKWQVTTTSGGMFQLVIHGGGGAGSEDGYLTQNVAGAASMQRLKYVGGGSTNLLSPVQTVTLATNTWFWTRFQRTGTTIQSRTWADGGSEPGSWDSTSTDSSHSSGLVGIGSTNGSGTAWVAQIGVGTGGDPAPDSPPSTGIPAHLMRRQHYGPRGLTGQGGPFNG